MAKVKAKPSPGPFINEVRLDRALVPSFDVYPFALPIVADFQRLPLHRSVTFLVGGNGSGKSTFLEAIAVAWGFNAEGGSRNFNFSTKDAHSDLHEYLTLVKTAVRPVDGYFLRAESYFNLASEVDNLEKEKPGLLASYGGKSLHAQSHGESFLSLFRKRFFGPGLYILDEPEAALSPDGILVLLARMQELADEGSQFIIATHSPILLLYPDAWIYELREGDLHKTPVKETRHFTLTRALLNRPETVLRELFRGRDARSDTNTQP